MLTTREKWDHKGGEGHPFLHAKDIEKKTRA